MDSIGFAWGAAVLLAGVPATASPGDTRWTAAQAEQAAKATIGCTGGEYGTRRRDAREILQSLPKAGETVLQLNEDRAYDVYAVAGALLKPAIPKPERAFDPGGALTCTPDPALGVALMTFLSADGPANRRGPNNSFYWLGQAYRHGAGVASDPARARHYFLVSRILGNFLLTSEDWGERPDETLAAVLARPANRAMLESAAAAGRSEAQFLLGDLVLATDKPRARALLRASARERNPGASRRLSDLEAQGAFGAPNFVEAAKFRAWLASLGNEGDLRAMLEAARAFNGGDIPVVDRKVSLDELGATAALAKLQGAERDSLVGKVPSRALLAPDGRILYTELLQPGIGRYSIGRDTLRVFDPETLKPVAPYVANGKARFAWLPLPTIDWR